jgi:hypothetical protein
MRIAVNNYELVRSNLGGENAVEQNFGIDCAGEIRVGKSEVREHVENMPL